MGWNPFGLLLFLYLPAFPMGEFFLPLFSVLTKVIKIATKLSVVSNSCVWKKADRRMLEETCSFEEIFSFCWSICLLQSCEIEANT